MNLVDDISPIERLGLKFFARDVQYQVQGAVAPTVLRAFLRGVKEQDTFASAMQQDTVAVVDAQQFVVFTGNQTPRRFDRVRTASRSYSIEEWRGAPNDDQPVFFKLLLRGGSQ
jgi:hypothetical protein